MLRVSDCVIGLGVPQPTEGQRIRNQIKAAFIFTWADFVNVRSGCHLLSGESFVDSPGTGGPEGSMVVAVSSSDAKGLYALGMLSHEASIHRREYCDANC
jgi:hypothetical protein